MNPEDQKSLCSENKFVQHINAFLVWDNCIRGYIELQLLTFYGVMLKYVFCNSQLWA